MHLKMKELSNSKFNVYIVTNLQYKQLQIFNIDKNLHNKKAVDFKIRMF